MAETGFLGLIALAFLLTCAIWRAFASAIRFRTKPGSEVFVGLGCGLLVISLHNFFEWVFVLYPSQYLFAAILGLISGMRSRYIETAKTRSNSRQRQRPPDLKELTPVRT